MSRMHCKFLITLFSSSILLSGCTDPSKKEPGIYVNEDPYFTIKYPKDWIPGIKYPDTVLSVVSVYMTPNLIVHIRSKSCQTLGNAPEEWVYYMKIFFPKTNHYKILSKKMIVLDDGSEAVKAKISWTWEDNIKLVTSLIEVKKDNKRINIICTGIEQLPFEFMEKITDSLSLVKK